MPLQKLITPKELTANLTCFSMKSCADLTWHPVCTSCRGTGTVGSAQGGSQGWLCPSLLLLRTRCRDMMGAPLWPPQFRNQNPSATLSQCSSPLGSKHCFFARKKSPLWGKDLGKLILFSSPLFRESRKTEQEAGQAGKGKMTMLSKAVKSVLVQLFLFFSPPFSLAPRGGQGVIMIMFSGISISLADLPATKVNPKSQRGGHIHPCLWDSFSEITLSFL